jgi:hypothetical protein
VANVVERNRGLPKALVIGIHRAGPGEVEHGPEQHRGMPVREHEPIAVGPDRVLGIEAHDAVPDRVHQRRERHRGAGVSGLGLLDRIHRERANGIDRQLIHLLVGHRTYLCASSYFIKSHYAGHAGERHDNVRIIVAWAQAATSNTSSRVARGWATNSGKPNPPRPVEISTHVFASTDSLVPSWSAAARSASTRARSRRTRPAGIDRSPSRRRTSIPDFSLPVTSQRTRRERLSIG